MIKISAEQAFSNALTGVLLSRELKANYVLGAGGRPGKFVTTRDGKTGIDCSGFVCYALGIDRFQPTLKTKVVSEWVNTDSLCADASGNQQICKLVGTFQDTSTKIQAGDLLVFPGLRNGNKRLRPGHVAIVVLAQNGKAIAIAHSTPSNVRRLGSAVEITAPVPWFAKPETLVVRPNYSAIELPIKIPAPNAANKPIGAV